MRVKLFLLGILLSILTGCSIFRPGFVREDSLDIAPETSEMGPFLGGQFEGEEWVPNNEEIALTYKVPDISGGILFDANSLKVSPCLQIELFEFDTNIPYVRTLKVDWGVAYQRTYFYLGKLWTSVFEISTGIVAGWDLEERQPFFGVAGTIIRF